MSARQTFLSALTSLANATAPTADLCGPFLAVLPIHGAAVSTLGDPLGTSTVCASDDRAARLDEIQIDLGEGPCWNALSTGRPSLHPDVQADVEALWPVASEALRATGLASVFAFPLVYGRLGLGAVDLYGDRSGALSGDDVDDAGALAGMAARQVLHRAVEGLELPVDEGDARFRREIHQASGMVSVQLEISVEDALLVIRGHAFAASRTVREIAADVVARRLDFSD